MSIAAINTSRKCFDEDGGEVLLIQAEIARLRTLINEASERAAKTIARR